MSYVAPLPPGKVILKSTLKNAIFSGASYTPSFSNIAVFPEIHSTSAPPTVVLFKSTSELMYPFPITSIYPNFAIL